MRVLWVLIASVPALAYLFTLFTKWGNNTEMHFSLVKCVQFNELTYTGVSEKFSYNSHFLCSKINFF